ncbi:hypothetical protein GCM10023226_04420 [Nocardioides nanhaiensis]|uniref:HTH marR-type domain-containing protein n=1 Tax=Nocardioides nanhaiensis TaxID=1476871 RepID=A0ABP8VUP9_9ACTN
MAERVVRGMREMANQSEAYIAAAGREAAMHRTDLTGLAQVMDGEHDPEGPVTPGRLSASMQLSAPATSAMLDRLERLGHVERRPHPTDRRSVEVVATDHAMEVGGQMFARVAARMGPVLAARSEEELAVIAAFLEDAAAATYEARRDIAEG